MLSDILADAPCGKILSHRYNVAVIHSYVGGFMAGGPWLETLDHILSSVASVVAIAGVSLAWPLWRFQKRAEREMAIAESVLEAATNTIQVIDFIRSPLLTAYELHEAEQLLLEGGWDKRQYSRRVWRNMQVGTVIISRIKNYHKEFEKLWSVEAIAKVHFGAEIANALDAITRQRAVISHHAHALTCAADEDELQREHYRHITSFSAGPGGDPVNVVLNECRELLENKLTPILKVIPSLSGPELA